MKHWDLPSFVGRRWGFIILVSAVALYFLYIFRLTGVGTLGPDEPRYAAIGRAMDTSGDWITPRLWNQPWFEKPPLLYWTTAVAARVGLGQELSVRLPVALISIAFLVFYFVAIRREFGRLAAWFSTIILATCAGWIGYSHVAVPDLPLAACFGTCIFLLLRTRVSYPMAALAGLFLGLGILAKALVPLALFVPAVWFLRRELRKWVLTVGTALVVAAPWHLAVALQNGSAFIDDYFWKQQIGRISSPGLQHVQPFWFYVPVLLAALYPWTPTILVLLRDARLYKDERVRFLLITVLWGLLFFSLALNKLPGYLLPLIPPLAAVFGVALSAQSQGSRLVLFGLMGSAVLLCLTPTIAAFLPDAFLRGLTRAHAQLHLGPLLASVGVAAFAAVLEIKGLRTAAIGVIAITTIIATVYIQIQTFPKLDATVSPRGYWRAHRELTCIPTQNRSWRYGLDFYSGRELPDCDAAGK